MPLPQKLIIDTDPGDDVDDVLALAFALLRPDLDVRAITTVTPFPDRRVHIVRKLLRLLGRTDIPVAAGAATPLGHADSEDNFNGGGDSGGGYMLNHYSIVSPGEAAAEPPVDPDAVGLILRTVEEYPGEVAVVTIGPVTNLAKVLLREPDIAGKIKWIAMMGGEVRLERAEHNVAWDPEAAQVVLTSGVPLFMGTWDVTRRVVLMPEHCALIRERGTPLTVALSRCIDLWWPHKGGKPGPVMYDLAPILWSLDQTTGSGGSSSHYETQPMRIHVQAQSEQTRGRTVVLGEGESNAEVTVDMAQGRAEAARDLLLKTLLA